MMQHFSTTAPGDTTSTGIGWTQENEQERVLNKWKKLHDETQELVDAMTWVGTGSHHKHPLEVMLYDIKKLIARLEQGLK